MTSRRPSARVQCLSLALLAVCSGLGAGLAGAAGAAKVPPCKGPTLWPTAQGPAMCTCGLGDAACLADGLARTTGLGAAAASRLAEAMEESALLNKSRRGKQVDLEAVRKIESKFILLLKDEPGNAAVEQETEWFYSSLGWTLTTPAPALRDLVASSPDPASFVLRLTGGGYDPIFLEILQMGVAVHPEEPFLWERMERITLGPADKIAFLAQALRTLFARPPAEGQAVRPIAAALATALIEEELDAGLPERALATFRGLPAVVRSWLEEGAHGVVELPGAGPRFHRELHDVRLDLALAFLLTGQRGAAQAMVRRFDAAPGGSVPAGLAPLPVGHGLHGEPPPAVDWRRRLAARWLEPTRDDPFDLFREGCLPDYFQPTPERALKDRFALAKVAEREGYPAFAAFALQDAGRLLSLEAGIDPVALPTGPAPRVAAAAAGLRAEILRRAGAFSAAAAKLSGQPPGPDRAAAAIARALASPPPPAFAEHPLPAGMAPIEPPPASAKARPSGAAGELSLPPGFFAVRAERQGDRAAAIGLSQDLDPTGEVSAGAYWVILSSDGGKTWSPPLYTGLPVNQPYVVRAASSLPLLAGDRLQVEVEVAELDPDTIFFPPVGLGIKRRAKGLYLEIPLAELTRDTDGDGLTDLAEARLLTDPRNPDTDGDGLPDGVDPLPLVPHRAAWTPASEALRAVIEAISGVGQRALVEGVRDDPAADHLPTRPPAPGAAATLFVVGERSLFAPFDPDRRIIVLTAAEAEVVSRQRVTFYPFRIELLVLDRAGHRGFAVWSSWQGGTFDLEPKDGRWVVKAASSWET